MCVCMKVRYQKRTVVDCISHWYHLTDCVTLYHPSTSICIARRFVVGFRERLAEGCWARCRHATRARDGPRHEPLNPPTATNAKNHHHGYDLNESPDHRITMPGNRKRKLQDMHWVVRLNAEGEADQRPAMKPQQSALTA
jgi:hypothetical protein